MQPVPKRDGGADGDGDDDTDDLLSALTLHNAWSLAQLEAAAAHDADGDVADAVERPGGRGGPRGLAHELHGPMVDTQGVDVAWPASGQISGKLVSISEEPGEPAAKAVAQKDSGAGRDDTDDGDELVRALTLYHVLSLAQFQIPTTVIQATASRRYACSVSQPHTGHAKFALGASFPGGNRRNLDIENRGFTIQMSHLTEYWTQAV